MWLSENGGGDSGVRVVAKEALCEQLVEVQRVSDRVMAVVLVFEEDVLRLICGYAAQTGRCFVENPPYLLRMPLDFKHWWWWCRPHPVREHAQDLRPPLGARPASPPTRQAAQPPPWGPSTNPRPLV